MQSAAIFFGKKLFYVYSGCCQLWNENEPRIASLEFDRDRKSMGVIVNSRAGKKSLLVKVSSPFLNVCDWWFSIWNMQFFGEVFSAL